ncbi:MAG: hypothetical protein WC719_02095 [Patescibacteria group bacterium]|jgi:hypothetical protein
MIELNNDQARALLFAIEAINNDDKLFLCLAVDSRKFKSSQVKEFVDQVFSDPICLKKAWDTPGFPFIGLNEIYKGITGDDHPVFVELFSYSFVSGPYGAREEITGEGIGFSPVDVRYLDVNKIFKESSRGQYLHTRSKEDKAESRI